MKKTRKSLLSAALAPLAALAVASAAPAARAQTNPCAPRARPANPCAPAAKPANPCAPAAKAANPCAPSAAAPAANAEAPAAPPKDMFDSTSKAKQAAFGGQIPLNGVQNYSRPAPYVATGGLVDPAAMDALAKLGFKTIISLNTEKEGAKGEQPLVEKAGMKFLNIEVSTLAPTAEQQAALAKAIDDPANYPILLHCESANRVGAAWALYRAGKGVAKETAIEEGRGVGMKPNREAEVRKQLGLAPL